jgi:peptidoglycan/LPS O-acetylase OafA/YrhL
MDCLAAGALAALLIRGPNALPRLRKVAKIVLAITGLIVAPLLMNDGSNIVAPVMQTIGYTLLACCFGSLMLVTATQRPGTLLDKALTFAPLRSFGKYSYALYVFHQLLARAYEQWFGVPILYPYIHSYRISLVAHCILSIAASYLIAWLSWQLYESHFLKLKRFFDYKRPRPATESAAASTPSAVGPAPAPALVNVST